MNTEAIIVVAIALLSGAIGSAIIWHWILMPMGKRWKEMDEYYRE